MMKLSKKINRYSRSIENTSIINKYFMKHFSSCINKVFIPGDYRIGATFGYFIFECKDFNFKLYFKNFADNNNCLQKLEYFNNKIVPELKRKLKEIKKISERIKKNIKVPILIEANTFEKKLIFTLNLDKYISRKFKLSRINWNNGVVTKYVNKLIKRIRKNKFLKNYKISNNYNFIKIKEK